MPVENKAPGGEDRLKSFKNKGKDTEVSFFFISLRNSTLLPFLTISLIFRIWDAAEMKSPSIYENRKKKIYFQKGEMSAWMIAIWDQLRHYKTRVILKITNKL